MYELEHQKKFSVYGNGNYHPRIPPAFRGSSSITGKVVPSTNSASVYSTSSSCSFPPPTPQTSSSHTSSPLHLLRVPPRLSASARTLEGHPSQHPQDLPSCSSRWR